MQSISRNDRCLDRAILALPCAYQEYLVTLKLMTSLVLQNARPFRTFRYILGSLTTRSSFVFRQLLLLVKLNTEFSSQVLKEVKATLALFSFLLAAKKDYYGLSFRKNSSAYTASMGNLISWGYYHEKQQVSGEYKSKRVSSETPTFVALPGLCNSCPHGR